MAVSVSVSGDAVLGFTITVMGANTGDKLEVLRADSSGHYSTVAVRGADMIDPTGATMAFSDDEAPINLPLLYTANSYDLSDLDTPTSTDSEPAGPDDFPSGFAIITKVLDVSDRVAGSVMELDTWTYEARILGNSRVLGRANPVINADVMSGRSGNILMNNLNVFDVDFDGFGPYDQYEPVDVGWSTIFASGDTLLFRSDYRETGFDDCYFKVTGLTVKRLHRPGGMLLETIRSYDISFTEVDRPLTGLEGLGLFSWADVMNNNADWQEVNDDHADWTDVLLNPTA